MASPACAWLGGAARPPAGATGDYNARMTVRKGAHQIEAQELRNAGLKATPSRMRILQVLESSTRKHLSAEAIYRELIQADENVGYATIYRSLTQFEAAGLVIRHVFSNGPAVYELAGDEHHDHMVCLETGQIIEFQNQHIEDLQEQIAQKHGYTLEGHSLVLYVRPRKK